MNIIFYLGCVKNLINGLTQLIIFFSELLKLFYVFSYNIICINKYIFWYFIIIDLWFFIDLNILNIITRSIFYLFEKYLLLIIKSFSLYFRIKCFIKSILILCFNEIYFLDKIFKLIFFNFYCCVTSIVYNFYVKNIFNKLFKFFKMYFIFKYILYFENIYKINLFNYVFYIFNNILNIFRNLLKGWLQ